MRSGPASGYRLAKAVGKARANVYQALSQLTQRGAVLIDDSQVQTFRATDPQELMRTLAESYRGHAEAARAGLQALAAPAADDRIYHLKTIDQLFERAVAMILRRLHFGRVAERGVVGDALRRGDYDAGGLIARLFFYAVLLITLQMAFNVFGPNPVSDLLRAIVAWLPRRASPSCTWASCSRLTSEPMRTPSLRGLPTTTVRSRATMASAAVSRSRAGAASPPAPGTPAPPRRAPARDRAGWTPRSR